MTKPAWREWWIHAGENTNLRDPHWFINVVIAVRNMWDSGQTVHVIEYAAYEEANKVLEKIRECCSDIDEVLSLKTERDQALSRIAELEKALEVFSWKINQCLRIECESCLEAIKELGQALERKGDEGNG